MNKATKILLVDDDRDLLQVLHLALDMHGFKVVCSNDGQEAFFKFRNENFDLIITDLKMPKMDGPEFINLVRRIKQTPIFVMSACIETFRLKLDDLKDFSHLTMIPKPFTTDFLIQKIKDLKKPPMKEASMDNSMMSFKAGELVFNEQSARTDLFIVKEGTFSVYKTLTNGDEIIVARLMAGEALDDMMLFSDKEQSSKVKADTDGILIRFPMEKIYETMSAQPAWFQIVMKTITTRLCNTTSALVAAKTEMAQKEKK